MNDFKEIYNKSILYENFDKDFFKLYDEENFVMKFLFKKFLRLFYYNNEIIGFIWYETPIDINIRIWALYIENKYVDLLDESLLKTFDNSILLYEGIDNNRNFNTLTKLGFKKIRPTILMKLDLLNLNNQSKINSMNISFDLFTLGSDEENRCQIQNDIFGECNRLPLTIEDIYNDINQDYYINDLSVFIKVNDMRIGYGQIVFNRDIYTVVNFGIISEYRHMGYGRSLLNKLINLSKERGIETLYIRVDENNIKARELYENTGFRKKYIISRWDR